MSFHNLISLLFKSGSGKAAGAEQGQSSDRSGLFCLRGLISNFNFCFGKEREELPQGWVKAKFGFAILGLGMWGWVQRIRGCSPVIPSWGDAENLPGPCPPLGHDSPFPALTPRAGCRWSRGRCRCRPAARPACPASSAPGGRTGSTARSRCAPRTCSRWRTWPGPGPAAVAILSRSGPGTNGHAPTCQFEFPTAPSHWAPQATPTPLKKKAVPPLQRGYWWKGAPCLASIGYICCHSRSRPAPAPRSTGGAVPRAPSGGKRGRAHLGDGAF